MSRYDPIEALTMCMIRIFKNKKWHQLRPLKYPDGVNMEIFNEAAGELINKFPNYAKPFTEKNKGE